MVGFEGAMGTVLGPRLGNRLQLDVGRVAVESGKVITNRFEVLDRQRQKTFGAQLAQRSCIEIREPGLFPPSDQAPPPA